MSKTRNLRRELMTKTGDLRRELITNARHEL